MGAMGEPGSQGDQGAAGPPGPPGQAGPPGVPGLADQPQCLEICDTLCIGVCRSECCKPKSGIPGPAGECTTEWGYISY